MNVAGFTCLTTACSAKTGIIHIILDLLIWESRAHTFITNRSYS